MRKVFFISMIGAFVFLLLGTSTIKAQSNIYKLQSLFIYNFVKNIKWENVGEEFTIGVYGSTEALNEIEANLSAKNLNGIKFKIQSISNAEEAKKCQLVFLPKSNHNKVVMYLSQISEPNILIVTEEDLIAEGASISFEMKNSKLNFIINKKKTEESGLKVSSALLSMGTVIG